MKYGIVVKPNELSQETSILIKSKDYLPFQVPILVQEHIVVGWRLTMG